MMPFLLCQQAIPEMGLALLCIYDATMPSGPSRDKGAEDKGQGDKEQKTRNQRGMEGIKFEERERTYRHCPFPLQ